MGRFVFLALLGMLCLISKGFSTNLERLMDNVLVLRVRNIDGSKVPVPLSCGEAFQNEQVTWKKNGVPQPGLQGNYIQVTVQEWGGGNYTCHQGPEGPTLNYTVIMVQLEPDNRTVILEPRSHEQDYIQCLTRNYRGLFHCSWSRSVERSDATVLLVKGHRNHEPVLCEVESSGSGMRCRDNVCPYEEERHRISLTVYMRSVYRLEAYTKVFFLREIVTPGPFPHLHLNGSVFKWDYPESWEKPCSFFSLLFHVKVVRNGEDCHSNNPLDEKNISKTEYPIDPIIIKPKRFVFCLRAQDKHTEGPWSHWSHCTMAIRCIL
uniref:Interleukin-12 subunit beta n=1 Tax=Periophthalmus magnuspinnatus TaxID=409849 RepID=A0A3B4B5R0_9GOBI